MLVNPHFLGEFSPLHIPGCALWLEADRGITLVDGKVSAWADQSGNGRHVSQATPSLRPTWEANQINGHPVVRFSGSNGMIFQVGFSQAANVTCIAIYKSTAPTDQSFMRYYNTSNPSFLFANGTGGRPYQWFGNAIYWPSGVSSYNIIRYRYTTSPKQGFISVNNATEVSGNITTLSLAQWRSFGWTSPDQHYWTGDIVYVCLFNRELTISELFRMEKYYSHKYNISLAA